MDDSNEHNPLRVRHLFFALAGSIIFIGLLSFSFSNVSNVGFSKERTPATSRAVANSKAVSMPVTMSLTREIQPGESGLHLLKGLKAGSVYSLSLSVESPGQFGDQDILKITLRKAEREILSKPLHLGDPDLYVLFRPAIAGDAEIRVTPSTKHSYRYKLRVMEWPESGTQRANLEAEPNDSWREANPIALEKTVYGTADDHLYIPLQGMSKRQAVEGNEDWFRFEFRENRPKLVFFELDLMERDNIPVDVSIFTVTNGEAKAYGEGVDPVTPPHEDQALNGNKFTTRVFREAGTYFVRVKANHPFYQLRTSVYEVPPYNDPRQAVRAGVDYIISAGDSWHANTPRKGAIYDRISNVHQETSLCVACHPTHFSQRAQLYSLQNGYPVQQRPQLQFLTERFYNNPRPFYGHPGATWSRVISAPANVLSRMAALLNIFEHEVTGEFRPKMLEGVAKYLQLYYKDRTELPPDETNGNTPLISTYEVAWYSWEVLDEQYRRSGDASYAKTRNLVRHLIEQNYQKNLLDLCFQTLAFCAMNKEAYTERIGKNCQTILSHQRPSGQWALSFEKDAPEAEFQTGACLWTLGVSGFSANHPQIAKGLQYLLSRQQHFGGWFDPDQSYENFRTPFRETQFAALALSQFYKGPGAKGWRNEVAPTPSRLSLSSPLVLLSELDNIWEAPTEALLAGMMAAAGADEALIRQAAIMALGRVAHPNATDLLKNALGDPNKMVQRSAAWALRQIASRRNSGFQAIHEALQDNNDRVRLGASRIFWTHFSALAERKELAECLVKLSADPIPTIRMNALKGLWQWWYWTADPMVRGKIEDAYLSRMGEEQHPWVALNLRECFYNIADENIRYLYNNWIPLLGSEEDRDKAVLGRLDVEHQIASKIEMVLKQGSDRHKRALLEGLTQFHLRSGKSYDLDDGSASSDNSLYVRIGIDAEHTAFFGRDVETIALALRPLLKSADPAVRRLATLACYTIREIKPAITYGANRRYGFADVLRLAGTDKYEANRQLLAWEILRNLMDPVAEIRRAASEVSRTFTIDAAGEKQAAAIAVLRQLLSSSYEEARRGALEVIRLSGDSLADSADLAQDVKEFVVAKSQLQTPALAATPAFPALHRDVEVLVQLTESLSSDDLDLFRVGAGLALRVPTLQQNPEILKQLEKALAGKDSKKRKIFVEILNLDRSFSETTRGIAIICDGLTDSEATIVQSALSIVRQRPVLQRHPAVLAALDETRKNPKLTPMDRYLADMLFYGQNASGQKNPAQVPTRQLDYEVFAARVQPILQARGKDGNACVMCHATHTIFRLNPPPGEGTYTEEQIQQNFRSALRVVNLLEPENSLLLRKPTSGAEVEGTVDTGKLSHGGGVRWQAGSPEYKTILAWINGASLQSASE